MKILQGLITEFSIFGNTPPPADGATPPLPMDDTLDPLAMDAEDGLGEEEYELDADGNPVLDAEGNPVKKAKEACTCPDAPATPDAAGPLGDALPPADGLDPALSIGQPPEEDEFTFGK